MARHSKTEEDALYRAIVDVHMMCPSAPLPYLEDLCKLYDKLSGVKYSKSKNTYEFITKGKSKGEK